MANIDKVSVKNTVYNIVSPAVVSDYIEVIGGACTKPDGYEEDEVILAKQNDVQLLFKATQDIAFGANIVENTNCVRTTLEEVLKNAGGGGGASSADQVSYDNSDSGLEAENVQEAVDELATKAGTASSQIQTLTNKVANMQDVNLLDNPWFTVNQRGQSSYSGGGTAGAKYTLDRWRIESYTNLDVSVNNDGSITLTNTSANENQQFVQVVEDSIIENGKTYTLSLDVVDYTNTVKFNLSGVSSPYPSIIPSTIVNQTGIISKTGTKGSETNTWKVAIMLGANASVTLRAVKLEKGSVSTLAQDTAPNYGEELMKCERYFMRIGGTPSFGHGIAGYGLTASSARCILWKGVNSLSVTLAGVSNLSDFKLVYDGKMVDVTNMSIVAADKDFVNIIVDVAETDLQYKPCYLRFNAANAYMDISADL